MSRAALLMMKGVVSELSEEETEQYNEAYENISAMYKTNEPAYAVAMSVFLLEKQIEGDDE